MKNKTVLFMTSILTFTVQSVIAMKPEYNEERFPTVPMTIKKSDPVMIPGSSSRIPTPPKDAEASSSDSAPEAVSSRKSSSSSLSPVKEMLELGEQDLESPLFPLDGFEEEKEQTEKTEPVKKRKVSRTLEKTPRQKISGSSSERKRKVSSRHVTTSQKSPKPDVSSEHQENELASGREGSPKQGASQSPARRRTRATTVLEIPDEDGHISPMRERKESTSKQEYENSPERDGSITHLRSRGSQKSSQESLQNQLTSQNESG